MMHWQWSNVMASQIRQRELENYTFLPNYGQWNLRFWAWKMNKMTIALFNVEKNAASIKHLAKLSVSVLPRGIPTETLLSQAVNREEGYEETEGSGQQPDSETLMLKCTCSASFSCFWSSKISCNCEKKVRTHENIFGKFQNGRWMWLEADIRHLLTSHAGASLCNKFPLKKTSCCYLSLCSCMCGRTVNVSKGFEDRSQPNYITVLYKKS